MHDKPQKGREVEVTAKLKNPLPLSIKDGKFLITGSSIPKTLQIKVGWVVNKNSDIF